MSKIEEWDIVHALKFEAINRKLTQNFAKEQQAKFRVKNLAALAMDSTLTNGLKTGINKTFYCIIKKGGLYSSTNKPSLEISFFENGFGPSDFSLSLTQPVSIITNVTVTPSATNNKRIKCPPGIFVRRHAADVTPDTGANQAVILSGLQVGNGLNISSVKTSFKDCLKDWLSKSEGIIKNINKVHNAEGATKFDDSSINQLNNQIDNLYQPGKKFTIFLSELLEYLLKNIWSDANFWQSENLKTLNKCKGIPTVDTPDNINVWQQLYHFAIHLVNQSPDQSILKNIAQMKAKIENIRDTNFFNPEIEQIKKEVLLKTQETMFKNDYNFITNSLTETTLGTLAYVSSNIPQYILESIMEAFACIAPTHNPDFTFSITKLAAPARFFCLRLGAWQLKPDATLQKGGLKISVPVLGGYFSRNAGNLFIVCNQYYSREIEIEVKKITYLDKIINNLNHQFAQLIGAADAELNVGYTEVVNETSWFDSPLVQPLFPNYRNQLLNYFYNLAPTATAFPGAGLYAQHSFSYTPLFSLINISDNINNQSKEFDWAKITTTKFGVRNLTGSGELYICCSTKQGGTTQEIDGFNGAEVANLDGDSLLYISKKLFLKDIILAYVLNLFMENRTSAKAPSPSAFELGGNSITNSKDIYLNLTTLENFFGVKVEQNIGALTLKFREGNNTSVSNTSISDYVFEVKPLQFSVSIDGDSLKFTLNSMTIKTDNKDIVIRSREVRIRFHYSKKMDNSFYYLDGIDTLGEIEVRTTNNWDTMYDFTSYTTLIGGGLSILGGVSFLINELNLYLKGKTNNNTVSTNVVAPRTDGTIRIQGGNQQNVELRELDNSHLGLIAQNSPRNRDVEQNRDVVQDLTEIKPEKLEAVFKEYEKKKIPDHALHQADNADGMHTGVKHNQQIKIVKLDKSKNVYILKTLLTDVKVEGYDYQVRKLYAFYHCTTNKKNQQVKIEFHTYQMFDENKYRTFCDSLAGVAKDKTFETLKKEKIIENKKDYEYFMNLHKIVLGNKDRIPARLNSLAEAIEVPLKNNVDIKSPTFWEKFDAIRKTKKVRGVMLILSGLLAIQAFMLPRWFKDLADKNRELEKATLLTDMFKKLVINIFNKIKYPFDEHFRLSKIDIQPDGVFIEMTQTTTTTVSFVAAFSKVQELDFALRHSKNKKMKITLYENENDYAKNIFKNGITEYNFKVYYANSKFTVEDYQYEMVGSFKELKFTSTEKELNLTIDNATFGDYDEADLIVLERMAELHNQEELFFIVELY